MGFVLVILTILVWFTLGAACTTLVDYIAPEDIWKGDERILAIFFWPATFAPYMAVAINQRLKYNRTLQRLADARQADLREREDRISLLELQRAEQELERFLKGKES